MLKANNLNAVGAGKLVAFCAVLIFLVGNASLASETAEAGEASRLWGFIPLVRNNPCVEPYRQVAVSPPLEGTSDSNVGFPWRGLYGYCVSQFGRWSLHQDWVVSYQDAYPRGDLSGGSGVSFGTDLSFQWRHAYGNTLTPYYEMGGGIQYTLGTPFPADGSRFMFTINVGAGLLIPLRPNLRLNAAIRYLHVSNANVVRKNSGYDGLQLFIGLRW